MTYDLEPVQLAVGDTQPAPAAVLRHLPEDPTGTTALFSLMRRGSSAEALRCSAAVQVIEELGGRWSVRLVADLGDAVLAEDFGPGEHYGRFVVSLVVESLPNEVRTVPPDGSLRVVYTSPVQ